MSHKYGDLVNNDVLNSANREDEEAFAGRQLGWYYSFVHGINLITNGGYDKKERLDPPLGASSIFGPWIEFRIWSPTTLLRMSTMA